VTGAELTPGAGRVLIRLTLPAAVAGLLVGAALLILSRDWAHIAGYCLGCLIPFCLVAAHRRVAVNVRARRGTVAGRGEAVFTVLLLVAGLCVGAVHAWLFAWSVS
jgi:hypothetical protein